MSLKNIYFILVRPQLGENIGASARALKNFGFNKLRIVNPRDPWPNAKAEITSVGASDLLKICKVFRSIDASIDDLDMVIATTSRARNVNKKIISMEKLKKKINKNKKIGFLFGPESSGLSNDDISYADFAVKIPTNKNFQSINLSHAVILFCYEIFRKLSNKKNSIKSLHKNKTVKKKEVTKFVNFLIFSLNSIGFLQPKNKKRSMIRNIRNIFYRIDLTDKEIRTLLGIFTCINRSKLKKR